jgi:hypothetical protein
MGSVNPRAATALVNSGFSPNFSKFIEVSQLLSIKKAGQANLVGAILATLFEPESSKIKETISGLLLFLPAFMLELLIKQSFLFDDVL